MDMRNSEIWGIAQRSKKSQFRKMNTGTMCRNTIFPKYRKTCHCSEKVTIPKTECRWQSLPKSFTYAERKKWLIWLNPRFDTGQTNFLSWLSTFRDDATKKCSRFVQSAKKFVCPYPNKDLGRSTISFSQCGCLIKKKKTLFVHVRCRQTTYTLRYVFGRETKFLFEHGQTNSLVDRVNFS